MKRLFILPVLVYLTDLCLSVPESRKKQRLQTSQQDTAKKNYLPVADYLKSEIATVDSFPYRLMRYQVRYRAKRIPES